MSDDLTFQDTPLYAWLRANVWYLLGGTVILLAILLYRENAPKWQQANRYDSWDQHRLLVNDPTGLEALETQLVEARKDERIYEWVVYNAAKTAADTADAKALALLKPELEALAKSSDVVVAGPDGPEKLAAVLMKKLYGGGSAVDTSPEAPEPEGARIAITLSHGETSTYEIVIGLYEEAAPLGTAALKEWIQQGRFADRTATSMGAMNLTFSLQPSEAEDEAGDGATDTESEQPPLMVERQYGYFHSEGTLSPGMLPGKPGVQDPNNLQLALSAAYNMDGQTTVLGKAVEGWQALKDAVTLAGTTATFQVVSARILE